MGTRFSSIAYVLCNVEPKCVLKACQLCITTCRAVIMYKLGQKPMMHDKNKVYLWHACRPFM